MLFRCNGKYEFRTVFVETRRSSENDSQGCDVPGFLKLGWSFRQLPKVRGSAGLEKNLRIQIVAGVRVLTCDLFSSVTASSHHVRHGLSSGSAPAAVCQIM